MDLEKEFIGRDDVLGEMVTAWPDTQIYGIYGTRSIGKSRLVFQFLRKIEGNEESSLRHLWIDLKQCRQMKDVFWPILNEFRLSDQGYNAMLLAEKVATELVSTEQSYILVFDNAEDVLDGGMEDEFMKVCDILLGNKGIKIIVTSTTRMDIGQFPQSYQKSLPLLSTTESMRLLETSAPSVEFGDYKEEIAKRCGGLPLALLIVAAELEQDAEKLLSPADMVELLMKFRLKVLSGEMYPSEDRIGMLDLC